MRSKFFLLLLLIPLFSIGQSYKKIHKKAIVIDTHNDVISQVVLEKKLNIDNDLTGKAHSDLARFKKGGVDVEVFSIFCDEHFGKDTAFKYANIQMDSLQSIINRNKDKITLVRTLDELAKAVKQKKIGAMMGVEGGHMIEDNLTYLDSLFNRGARYLTLTWNNSTSWATSAMDESSDTLKRKKGLTDFGRQVVQRMNALGMLVDVSHVGEQTFWDVLATTTKPVIASHSCVYTISPLFRNLKDDQIKAIAKNGGVIHLNFYSAFVDSNYTKRLRNFINTQPQTDSLLNLKWTRADILKWMLEKKSKEMDALRPPLSLLLDHLEYIIKIAGIDHVGLGSDFDGITSSPTGLDDVADFPNITKELVARGFSRKDIDKILGGNFIRVFKANNN
jgi:membrane dipeptidase